MSGLTSISQTTTLHLNTTCSDPVFAKKARVVKVAIIAHLFLTRSNIQIKCCYISARPTLQTLSWITFLFVILPLTMSSFYDWTKQLNNTLLSLWSWENHWTESNPELIISGKVLGTVDNFTYLRSYITSGGHIAEDLSMRTVKARVAFCNLRHLWRCKDVSSKVKWRVCNAAVHTVLLYASETWPMWVEYVRRLSVFDHRCSRSLAGFN